MFRIILTCIHTFIFHTQYFLSTIYIFTTQLTIRNLWCVTMCWVTCDWSLQCLFFKVKRGQSQRKIKMTVYKFLAVYIDIFWTVNYCYFIYNFHTFTVFNISSDGGWSWSIFVHGVPSPSIWSPIIIYFNYTVHTCINKCALPFCTIVCQPFFSLLIVSRTNDSYTRYHSARVGRR